VSHTGAGNLCDVAPSRFKRLDRDEYFTIDAGWIIIPALCCAVQVEGPILEPCAGRGLVAASFCRLLADARNKLAEVKANRDELRQGRHQWRRRAERTLID
jgi:hypothetical protein